MSGKPLKLLYIDLCILHSMAGRLEDVTWLGKRAPAAGGRAPVLYLRTVHLQLLALPLVRVHARRLGANRAPVQDGQACTNVLLLGMVLLPFTRVFSSI